MRLQPLPFLLPLCVVAHEFSKTHGVPPALLARYSPSKTQTWSCLDGSKEISWSAVNDDYCDCSDGSDEPGTGACSNTTFYCQNAGHIGSTIPASRVRDGLCEPECCDGSDEPPGVCADTCLEVGQVYRRKVDAERKLRKTGAKIRSSYIAFARKEKDRLEASIAIAKQEVFAREKEVARLKEIADRSEALSAEALELKKQSPLYGSLLQHANALKSLQREHKKHLEREKTLGDILDALRRGYNPNYQDMAVLEAVRGWEYIAQLPHIGSEDSEGSADEADTETDEEDLVDDDMWSAQELKDGLDELLQTNYVSLLLEHDTYTNGPVTASLLSDVSAYLPDAIIPQYERLRDTIVSWLRHLGVIESGQLGTPSAGAAKAKDALLNAERDLATAKKELDNAVQDLDELFDPKFFGASGEWRKLSNQCLSKDTGDYTYEVCLFGEAKQKPNGGGQTFSLGHFSGWNDKAPVGSSEYYARQMYTLGTKCWNGPQRSVKLDLACGVENTLVSIQELEKCEYLFTGTTPTLCTSLDALELAGRDEL